MDTIEAFWRAYADAAGLGGADYAVSSFGDNPAMADQLAALVLAGRKRATACLVRDVEAGVESAPVEGGHVVMIDGSGAPRAIWRTTQVRKGPLSSVDDAFAFDEGEGDRTRADWLKGHHRYFSRQAQRDGFAMHDDIEVFFERFEIVWPREAADR